MANKAFNLLDFDKYSRLLRSIFPSGADVTICNMDGDLLWTTDLSARNHNIDAAAFLKSTLSVKSSDIETVRHSKLGDGNFLYSMVMTNDSGEQIGALALVVDCTIKNHKPHSNDIAEEFLQGIAACIKSEHQIVAELDGMAGELAERYDELNLVYDTDDHVNGLQEARFALQILVDNCATYMDVGMSTLLLPDRKICISHIKDENLSAEKASIVSRLRKGIFSTSAASKCGTVVNSQMGARKALSIPVLGGDGNVTGILATIKNSQMPDYTNSDRNLLEVMSRKVTKILQTVYDPLTGQLNRSGYEYHVRQNLLASQEQGTTHCILDLDIDDLQIINDTISYQAGDEIIKNVAKVIDDLIRDTDILSRTGGDEFGVLLDNCTLEDGESVAEKIRLTITALEYTWQDQRIEISTTIGVAAITPDSESPASVISTAEVARNAAKESGKNRVQVYKKGNSDLIRRKGEMQWVSRIKNALRENRFQIYSQVIVPLSNRSENFHVEILLRLRDENGDILTPWAFIPAAERYHLMPDIDKWVINKTLSEFVRIWKTDWAKSAQVSINLSGQSMSARDFLGFVIEQLGREGVVAKNICFEITESAAIENIDEAKEFISSIRKRGCRFSLDDFGTGLSSFAYLKNLSVDYLKIDGSFVKEIIDDPVSNTMVSAINQVGHVMGLETLAEFVENQAIMNRLAELGIDYAQGYGIGKPMPLEKYLDEISNIQRAPPGKGKSQTRGLRAVSNKS